MSKEHSSFKAVIYFHDRVGKAEFYSRDRIRKNGSPGTFSKSPDNGLKALRQLVQRWGKESKYRCAFIYNNPSFNGDQPIETYNQYGNLTNVN